MTDKVTDKILSTEDAIRESIVCYYNEACELFSKCSDIGVSPDVWIYNQKSMRDTHVEYITSLSTAPTELVNYITQMPIIEYMQYMYDTYPAQFGEILLSKISAKYGDVEEYIKNNDSIITTDLAVAAFAEALKKNPR